MATGAEHADDDAWERPLRLSAPRISRIAASATRPTAWPTSATIAAGCTRLARPAEEVRDAPHQRRQQRRGDHVLAAAAAAR